MAKRLKRTCICKQHLKLSRFCFTFLYILTVFKGYVVYLCRQEECYSTVTGVQEHSIWWHNPAAHSRGDRRKSASLLLDKKPFQSSACWWKLHRGSCMAHTFQLRSSTIYLIKTIIIFMHLCTVETVTHCNFCLLLIIA